MKKQILFMSSPILFRKTFFGIIYCTILSLLTAQHSFAQNWNILGNESQVSSDVSAYTSIAVLNDVPYVVFREATGAIVKVKKRNPSTGNWEQLGNDIGANLTFPRIILDKTNQFYVTYVDAANGNKLAVKIYNTATDVWEPLNNDINNLYVSTGSVTNSVSQYGSTPRCSLTFDSDNNPYIAFGENGTLTP